MTPVRLEHAAPRSRVKHSTTETLRSLFSDFQTLNNNYVKCEHPPSIVVRKLAFEPYNTIASICDIMLGLKSNIEDHKPSLPFKHYI